MTAREPELQQTLESNETDGQNNKSTAAHRRKKLTS
jgi:hypothetical protein